MKKLFITVMAVAMATASFAQDIAKEMKGKSYNDALATLNAAFSGLSNEQKAKGYAALTDIAYPEASKSFLAYQTGQKDGLDYETIYNALDAAVKCDSFDNQPNDKGKVSPKFHKKNAERLNDMRVMLIIHGQELMNANQSDPEALRYLEGYVNIAYSSLFKDIAGLKDPNAGNVARVVAFLYAQKEDYVTAKKFAEIAYNDTTSRADAEGIYLAVLEKSLKSHQDTLEYIDRLKTMDANKYMPNIVALYDRLGQSEMAAKIIDDAIAQDPNNKMAYAMKGETAMSANDWDAAIAAFNKTVELDPKFAAVWFNLGVCAMSKGAALNDALADKQGNLTPENDAKVKAAFVEAKKYYEKVRELDPDYMQFPNWPRQLRMVYNVLGETENASAISKMLGEE